MFYLLQCNHCFHTLKVDKYIACRFRILIKVCQMHHMLQMHMHMLPSTESWQPAGNLVYGRADYAAVVVLSSIIESGCSEMLLRSVCGG